MDGGGGVGVPNTSEALSVCMSLPVYLKDCYKLHFIILAVTVVIEKFLQVTRLLLIKFSKC